MSKTEISNKIMKIIEKQCSAQNFKYIFIFKKLCLLSKNYLLFFFLLKKAFSKFYKRKILVSCTILKNAITNLDFTMKKLNLCLKEEEIIYFLGNYFCLDEICLFGNKNTNIIQQIMKTNKTLKPGSIKKLELTNFNFDEYFTGVLVDQVFNQLEILYLVNEYISIKPPALFFENLFNNRNYQFLKELKLTSMGVGDEGVKCISTSEMPRLRLLDLSNNSISEIGCEYLTAANFLELNTLILKNNVILEVALKYLANGKFNKLTNLNLVQCSINDEGIRYLSNGVFKELTSLNLGYNEITNTGIKYLSNANFKNLSDLKLNANSIDDEDVKLLSVSVFKGIKFLDLSNNDITDEGVNILSSSVFTNNIISLIISGNKIGDKGVEYLCLAYDNNKLSKIKTIRLEFNDITEKGAEMISMSNLLKNNLSTLCIFSNNINEPGDYFNKILRDNSNKKIIY
jgi:hypothetical protein